MRSSWEQTRVIAYYIYCSYPKKGRNPTMDKFKKEHIPFSWDKLKNENDEEYMSYEQPISPDEWKDRISRMQNGIPIKAESVKGI